MQASAYRFDRFELLPAERQLLVDGAPARLGARAFDVLLALVEGRSRTVTRHELFDRVWAGRVVEDQNLRVQINALRKLLGPAAIATIPGRGYRFTARLAEAADASPDDSPGPPPDATAARVPESIAPGPAPCSNLPADLPPLYGRVGDIGTVYRLLSEHRLVTIAGPGGIGKTRLAQAVGLQMRMRFDDGVWLVELASLADPAELPLTVARALGLSGSREHATAAGLAHALRAQSALIVLDNCEHLLDAAGSLAQALLRGAPRLTLLATSQEPLKLADEQVFRLDALAVPPADRVQDALQFGAVALFAARARAADPRFVLDEGNVDAVSDICRQLDGIPLALELAAARVPLLGVAGVRERLGDRLRLLRGGARTAPARHQTLRGALEWSHALLSDEEKAALRRLGAFAGSFALEAAQAVIAAGDIDEWAALDHLGALVDKSLVQVLAGETPRYRMLESARAFALEQLEAAGEGAATRARHAAAMLAQFERAHAVYLAVPAFTWLDRLLPELDNLREAFRWASGPHGEPQVALGLAAYSTGMWVLAGVLTEGAAMCNAARPLLDAHTPPRLAARYAMALAQYGGSGISDFLAPPAAYEAAQRALDLYRTLGDPLHEYWALNFCIPLAERAGVALDVDAAIAAMRALEQPDWPPLVARLRRGTEARRLGRLGRWDAYRDAFRDEAQRLTALGEWRGAWFAAQSQALAEVRLGDPAAAVATMRPVVAEVRAQGRLRQVWTPLGMLAMALVEHGDVAAAHEAIRELVPLMQLDGSVLWGIDHMAMHVAQRGDWDGAARLHGWSDAKAAARGEQRGPVIREAHARLRTDLQARFTPDELARLRATGAALTDDEVVALVLGRPG